MKLLLFSDSHGNIKNMIDSVKKFNNIDLIIHLGDMVNDALSLKTFFNKIDFEIISGNNDYYSNYPTEKIILIENRKILLTHGHNYSIKSSYNKLISKCYEESFDAAFFGHTHYSEEIILENTILINPGSIGAPHFGYKPSFYFIEISYNGIFPTFHTT